MNIEDIMNSMQANVLNSNTIGSRMAKKSEFLRINRIADDCVSDLVRRISDEMQYIANGLKYNYDNSNSKIVLSDDDKKDLTNYLEKSIKEIPDKIKNEIGDIFSNDECDGKCCEMPNDKQVDISIEKIEPIQASVPATMPPETKFGY